MSKMFLIFCLMVVKSSLNAETDNEEKLSVIVSSDPRYFANQVFIGADEDMPINSHYYIAISPKLDRNGVATIPTTIKQALIELSDALPNWYLNELARKKHQDLDCSVSFDERDVTTLIDAWVWVHWFLPKMSPLTLEFSNRAVQGRTMITNAFQSAHCDYVRTESFSNTERIISDFSVRN